MDFDIIGDYYNARGLKAYGEGNFVEARVQFEKASERGNCEASHSLGFLYENGIGVAKNLTQAVEYYDIAGRHGVIESYLDAARVSKMNGGVMISSMYLKRYNDVMSASVQSH